MLTEDLKTISELMEIAGGEFPVVHVDGCLAYATNGKAMVKRVLKQDGQYTGFIHKDNLPVLKGLLSVNKKNEYINDDIDHLFIDAWKFPLPEQMNAVFDAEFMFELNFDANDLIKAIKSMKSKDNSIILKIKNNSSPFMISHENGKAIIATRKD